MTEQLYRVKPLVWVEQDAEDGDYCPGFEADVGDEKAYIVWRNERDDPEWHWGFFDNRDPKVKDCDSLARGQELAQKHWESQVGIGRFLEPVETKVQS